MADSDLVRFLLDAIHSLHKEHKETVQLCVELLNDRQVLQDALENGVPELEDPPPIPEIPPVDELHNYLAEWVDDKRSDHETLSETGSPDIQSDTSPPHRPAAVPKLHLDGQVPSGSWLTGQLTAGDTYVT
ncbi:MAG: hypothetical protein KVP17_002752 [Porospora cf. gigantea B]|uniref:uncharacterized protein n=1 Tax=Porospora cf. gigantea B TaxID=2853592 RepID=UPI003571A037|nr:MAG: hypothetical protein KVP17_002752 [Porospora cf. gigantea B]